jgi:DME family drug/metabolite transporter
MKYQTSSGLAWSSVLAAGALWGVGALVAQFVMARGVTPTSLSLARFALGLPLLWWWHWRQSSREPGAVRWQNLGWRERSLVMGTGAAMALNVTSWFAGIALIGAALPTVISICCAPVLVAIFSVLRGYERASLRLVLALVVALAGVMLIVLPRDAVSLPTHYMSGLLWSFASAVLYALVVLGNARMPTSISATAASTWGMGMAASLMLVIALLEGITWPHGTMAWLQVGYTGVVTTSIAYLAFAWGARRLPPTAAVVGTLVEPLVAAMATAWLSEQPLSEWQWGGAVMLGLAMVLLVRKRSTAAINT